METLQVQSISPGLTQADAYPTSHYLWDESHKGQSVLSPLADSFSIGMFRIFIEESSRACPEPTQPKTYCELTSESKSCKTKTKTGQDSSDKKVC